MLRVFLRKAFYRRKGDVGGRMWAPHHVVARQRGGHASLWCGQPICPLWLPSGLRVRVEKIGTSGFTSSNSENISRTIFLKYKNSRKQELTLWHLVNRLVPKMHKNAMKCK